MPISANVREELKEALLSRYEEAQDQLRAHLVNLLRPFEFFPEREMDQRVGTRIKDEQDIIEKVDRERSRQVDSLDQLEHKVVTDIVGGRVILDYAHQVNEFCREVCACSHWTIEKNNRGRVNRHTGYRSHHLDLALGETTRYTNIRCELQVRSHLQQAFASWSHPVYRQYRKDPQSIPDVLRGRLRQTSDQLNALDKLADKLYKDIGRVIT